MHEEKGQRGGEERKSGKTETKQLLGNVEKWRRKEEGKREREGGESKIPRIQACENKKEGESRRTKQRNQENGGEAKWKKGDRQRRDNQRKQASERKKGVKQRMNKWDK